jgi:hypothetical protein
MRSGCVRMFSPVKDPLKTAIENGFPVGDAPPGFPVGDAPPSRRGACLNAVPPWVWDF